jgi:cytochrome c biogenesis protein CcmG/thiol:disulfide interchange protein DsbE
MTSKLIRPVLSAGCLLLALTCTAGAPELAEYRGHVVWLDFWASWCGPCQQSFPWMQQIQQRYAARGLIVVAINLDHTRDDAERFLAAHPHDFVVRFDATGALPKAMHVSSMPTSFLLDAQGKIVATHTGFKPANEGQYEAELERILRGSQS